MNGRNAATAFNQSRADRFGQAKKEREEQRFSEMRSGLRRSMLVVDADEVRQGDEVLTVDSEWVENAGRSTWFVNDGSVMVRRFVNAN